MLREWFAERGVETGEKWAILGNGPSLREFGPGDYSGRRMIGFNRVDKFLEERNITLDVYVGVSDNVVNPDWGAEWARSTVEAIKRSRTVLLSTQVMRGLGPYSTTLDRSMHKILNVDALLTEPPIFSQKAYPYLTNFRGKTELLSKTGTSVNVAYSLLCCLKAANIALFGCDLGWQKSSGGKDSDANHYFKDYRAKIYNPKLENLRMDFVHMQFAQKMRAVVPVENMSSISSIEYFPRPKQQKGSKPVRTTDRMRRLAIIFVDENARELKRLIMKVLRWIGIGR